MRSSLRLKLSFALLLTLLAILSTQWLIRQFFTLPRFQAQEHTIDKQALEQLKASVDHSFSALAKVVYDNAVWAEMLDRMAARDVAYLNDTYNDIDFFNVLNVNGIHFFGVDQDPIWGMTLDEANQPWPVRELMPITPNLASAWLIDRQDWEANGFRPVTHQGFSRLDGHTVMFISVSVTLPGQRDRFEGTIVFWRLLDEEWLTDLREATRSPVTLAGPDAIPARYAVDARDLFNPDTSVQRVDGQLTVLFRDVNGTPILTLGRPAQPRVYSSQLLDVSLMVQILVAILALAAFYLYLNVSTIRPLHRLTYVIDWVRRTGNYGKRSGLRGQDEIGRLARHVDTFLDMIGSQRQELLSHNHRLQLLSDTDQLTGLNNRRYLESLIDRLEHDPSSTRHPASVLLIDIDYFKQYNDHYGHAAGDRTLRQIAHLLQGLTHSATDDLARFGGEEFILVLRGTNNPDAVAVAERLKASVIQLAIPHLKSPIGSMLTISIGIATKPAGVPFDYSRLFKVADKALYQAKASGRNTIQQHILKEPEHS